MNLESGILVLLILGIWGILVGLAELDLLNLQCDQTGVASSLEEVSALKPEAWNTGIPPDSLDLALLVKGPACVHLVGGIISDDSADGISHRSVSSCKDDDVCLSKVAIGKLQSVGVDLLDLLSLLDLDLSLGDKLGAADVQVVATSISEVLHEKTRVVTVELETDLLESIEDRLIELGNLLCALEMELSDKFSGEGSEEDIGIVDWWATLLVESVEPSWKTMLGRNDIGTAALNDGGICSVLVEFSCNIVSGVAASDNNGLLSLPSVRSDMF